MAKISLRIRLRMGIAVMFLAIVLPLTVVMIAVLFQQNARLARQMAEQSMEMAGREVATAVNGLIGDLSNAVELSVAFGRAQQEALRRPESLRPLLEELERLPEAYSLYFGMHADGGFFQVVRLSPDILKFGPRGAKPPAGAKWALRTIEAGSGERRDTYLYLSDWGKVVGVERTDPTYDPRQRPWYKTAMSSDKVASSEVYVFSGTGRPGLTLSHRLATEDGLTVGVFGADLSIAALAKFLNEHRVGQSGVSFILDEQQRLVGYPDVNKILATNGGKAALIAGEAVNDAPVAAAIKAYHAGAGRNFSVEAADATWLAHFRPFPDQFGRKWTIGMVAAEDDFIGPLKQTSLIIVIVGLAFILLAAAGIVWISRILVRPIHQLIGETERIRDFQLDGPVSIKSPVMEIDSLAGAIASMKAGLASFGTYVPKSLVHDIIRAGAGTGVGGERRPLTVMFTDLEGFTEAAEGMEPEQVLHWLSDYFDHMSQAIHAHHGTIDKFIGDAVMGMWNAPLADADHVAHACQALLACRKTAHTLGNDGNGPPLRTRIGLHTGTAMVGNVGSSDRMQYTALGSMVNLASRVEGLNKQFGTELLVTEAVVAEVGTQFLFRPFGPVLVVGASQPLEVFELIGNRDDERGDLDLWQQAFSAWQAGDWQVAADAFAAYSQRQPHDLAAPLFCGKARQFATDGTPADWDGVLRFTSK